MPHDSYLEPYRQSINEHGAAFEATLWASPRSQVRRFEVFTQMCHFHDRRILDAGCSRGDLAAYLLEHGGFAKYVGVDGLAEVIDFARTRRMPNCEFHVGDFVQNPAVLALGKPQIVCISGSLNTMTMRMALEVLESAWRATEHILLFNFLSNRCSPEAPPQTGPAFRLDTMTLLDWAMSHTSQIAMRHDYFKHGHDATIMMRKPE